METEKAQKTAIQSAQTIDEIENAERAKQQQAPQPLTIVEELTPEDRKVAFFDNLENEQEEIDPTADYKGVRCILTDRKGAPVLRTGINIIYGQPGHKKTTEATAEVAAYLYGYSCGPSGIWRREGDTFNGRVEWITAPRSCVWIDTEQEKGDCLVVLKRIAAMSHGITKIGKDTAPAELAEHLERMKRDKTIRLVSMCGKDGKDMLNFLRGVVEFINPMLVVLDNALDLVESANDEAENKRLALDLNNLFQDTCLLILTHAKRSDGEQTAGHTGGWLDKKAATKKKVEQDNKDKSRSKVTAEKARGSIFAEDHYICFTPGEDTPSVILEENAPVLTQEEIKQNEYEERMNVIFAGKKQVTSTDAYKRLMDNYKKNKDEQITRDTAKNWVKLLVEKQLIQRTDENKQILVRIDAEKPEEMQLFSE